MSGLDTLTVPRPDLAEPLPSGKLECRACAHRCKLAAGRRGVCRVRYRDDDGGWFSFSGSSFRAERGIPAELGASDDDARFWRYPEVRRTLAVVSGGTGDRQSPFGGRGDLESSFGVDVGRFEIDSYPDSDYDVPDSFEDGDDRTLTLRVLGDQTLGAHSDLRGAFTFAEVRHDESVPDGDFRYRQQLWSAGVENVWRLMELSLIHISEPTRPY